MNTPEGNGSNKKDADQLMHRQNLIILTQSVIPKTGLSSRGTYNGNLKMLHMFRCLLCRDKNTMLAVSHYNMQWTVQTITFVSIKKVYRSHQLYSM